MARKIGVNDAEVIKIKRGIAMGMTPQEVADELVCEVKVVEEYYPEDWTPTDAPTMEQFQALTARLRELELAQQVQKDLEEDRGGVTETPETETPVVEAEGETDPVKEAEGEVPEEKPTAQAKAPAKKKAIAKAK